MVPLGPVRVGFNPLLSLRCLTVDGEIVMWEEPSAPQLKFAGWDNLVVKGKAAEPTYLYIEDDKIEFRSAKDLWGKGIDECMHTRAPRGTWVLKSS